jgi:hypothetical protein
MARCVDRDTDGPERGDPVILDAADFGCVASGRWLRKVAVAAGSSVLTVPSGAVLGVDVGASISIPGAADMSATIEKLPGAKPVEGAAIDAGSPNLTVPVAGIHSSRAFTEGGASSSTAPARVGVRC